MSFQAIISNDQPLNGIVDNIEIIDPTDADVQRLKRDFDQQLIRVKKLLFGGGAELSLESITHLIELAVSQKIQDFRLNYYGRLGDKPVRNNAYEELCGSGKEFKTIKCADLKSNIEFEYMVSAVKKMNAEFIKQDDDPNKSGVFRHFVSDSNKRAKAIVLSGLLAVSESYKYGDSTRLREYIAGYKYSDDVRSSGSSAIPIDYVASEKAYRITVPRDYSRDEFSELMGIKHRNLSIDPKQFRRDVSNAWSHTIYIPEATLDTVLGIEPSRWQVVGKF